MSLFIGVSPAARGGLSLATLFWNGQWPVSLLSVQRLGSVEDTVNRIVGMVGEWGELSAVGIDAPLTWSGAAGGWREVDGLVRKRLPPWAPRGWVRPPLALPSSVTVQGVALAWSLASEIRQGQLPRHSVIETRSRVSLAQLVPDLSLALTRYASPRVAAPTRQAHVTKIVERFVDAGLVRLELGDAIDGPGLEALIGGLTALGVAIPDAGLVVHELGGGSIRPVGRRPVALLVALP